MPKIYKDINKFLSMNEMDIEFAQKIYKKILENYEQLKLKILEYYECLSFSEYFEKYTLENSINIISYNCKIIYLKLLD